MLSSIYVVYVCWILKYSCSLEIHCVVLLAQWQFGRLTLVSITKSVCKENWSIVSFLLLACRVLIRRALTVSSDEWRAFSLTSFLGQGERSNSSLLPKHPKNWCTQQHGPAQVLASITKDSSLIGSMCPCRALPATSVVLQGLLICPLLFRFSSLRCLVSAAPCFLLFLETGPHFMVHADLCYKDQAGLQLLAVRSP